MKEHPIIFSGPMVRAILDGRKTQTRRVINSAGNSVHIDRLLGEWGLSEDPISYEDAKNAWASNNGYFPWRPTREPKPGDWLWVLQTDVDDTATHVFRCPYGSPGDVLWVREVWRVEELESGADGVRYPADGAFVPIENSQEAADRWLQARRGLRFRPSIHMPRWACLLLLTVTDVRVERVQDISEEDAIAEGVPDTRGAWENLPGENLPATRGGPREAFRGVWDSINAKRGYSWESNPWVWVVSFEVRR